MYIIRRDDGMDIDLELYRIFREVAKIGNISKAAEKLFVSQSAVSQAIMQLENKIGGKLFDRSVRGVKLTVEGDVLFSHIDNAILLIENAQKKNYGNDRVKFRQHKNWSVRYYM